MILYVISELFLEDYLAENTHNNTWRCLICQKEFTQRRSAKRHFDEVHCKSNRSQCHLCYKWLKNARCLRSHIALSHKAGL